MLTLNTSSANNNKTITLVSNTTTKSELLCKSSGGGSSIWLLVKSLKWVYFLEVDLTDYVLCIAFDYFPPPPPPHPRLEKMFTPLTVIFTFKDIRREPFFQKRMLDSSWFFSEF